MDEQAFTNALRSLVTLEREGLITGDQYHSMRADIFQYFKKEHA